MNTQISINNIKRSRLESIDFNNLEFGKNITDHMFSMDHINGVWLNARITPFSNLSISPASLGLHYGQTAFEGMKAFKMIDGNISIFRIDKHYKRFSRTLERMCMPVPPFEFFTEGLKALVNIDRKWVPLDEGASLYIRPFMFATEERFGVNISNEYKFIIFSGPVKKYYENPLRVKIEENFMRAGKGGTGFAKCGGNYGGSFYPAQLAKEKGFDQVLWTDCSQDLNIEESGTMNIIFVIDNVVVTPALSDSILDGVTRDSFLTLAKDLGYKTEERKVSQAELIKACKESKLNEAFGSGTAAVASQIKVINMNGADQILPDLSDNSFMVKAKKLLSEIRTGIVPDKYNWNTIV